MIKTKDGYVKLIGTTYLGSANYLLLANGGAWAVHIGRNNEANKIVRTDASGYLQVGWFNTTSGDMGTGTVSRIYCSNDSFIRYKTPANFFSALTNEDNQLSITIGSYNRKLTVAYATNADTLGGTHKSGLLTALSSTATTNLSITVGGTTKTITDLYANEAVNADKLDGLHKDKYLYYNYYHPTNGLLIKTDILTGTNTMTSVHITGNSYGAGKTIDTRVEFYNYDANNSILSYSAINNGYNIPYINIFCYNNCVHLWIPYSGINYLSYSVFVNATNSNTNYNRVSSLTNASMPTEGVTRLVKVTPKQTALITDNVASATKLQTPRSINGTDFDGTKDIVTAYWGPSRTITLSGAVTGSVSTNGSGNITINTTYGTGNITNLDARYVNITGDTMTGQLTVPSLSVASGYSIKALNTSHRLTTPYGYVEIGAKNNSHAHIYTDMPTFYFDKDLVVNGYKVWHSGNDGSGSGLDADKLDGIQGSEVFRKEGLSKQNLDADNLITPNVQYYPLDDMNTWSGISFTNFPTEKPSGGFTLLTLKEGHYLRQIYSCYNNRNLYHRYTYYSGDVKWSSWYTIANISDNVASATKVKVTQNTSSNNIYPLVWTSSNSSSEISDLYKSHNHLCYNPSTHMLTSGGFIKSGSSNSYILLGGGGHKLLSELGGSHSHSNYVTTNTDLTISGIKTFSKQQKFTVAQGTAPFTVTSNTKVANLNADLLDGVHYQNILERDYSKRFDLLNIGWYRIAQTILSDAYNPTFKLFLLRTYQLSNNEGYCFDINISYNGKISITQTSGTYNTKAIDKIRVVGNNTDIYYVDIHYNASVKNTIYWTVVGCAKAIDVETNIPTFDNITEFETVKGCKSNLGFVGTLTGNATSATKLQTKRTINGTNFDGTANIVTSYWGTSRNITIGNTTKAVNGSANVAWSLSEIGAASSSHTHSLYLQLLTISGTTDVSSLKDTRIYYTTSDGGSQNLVNSPFTNTFSMILIANLISGDADWRRSAIAFNPSGEIKIFNDRGTSGEGGVWYNILTSNNSSVSKSGETLTVKINGVTQSLTNTNTTNTTGATNTASKIFLVGATSQGASVLTYSQDTAFVGTDGCLYSGGTKVSVNGHTHNYITPYRTSLLDSDTFSTYIRNYAKGVTVITNATANVGNIGSTDTVLNVGNDSIRFWRLYSARGTNAALYFLGANGEGTDWDTKQKILTSANSSVSKSGETLTVKINNVTLTLTNTNTVNTAGSTNTSSKIFLIGATSQASSPVTYSHDTAYVGTDGCLYSNNTKVSVEGHTHNYIKAKATYSFTADDLPNSFIGISAGFVKDDAGYGNYGSVLTIRTATSGGGSLQLYSPYSPTYGGNNLKARFGNYSVNGGNSWTDLKTIAWIDDITWDNIIGKPTIPVVTNYYWANVKIGSTANNATSPTFANTYVTGLNRIYAASTDTTHLLNLMCESTYGKIQTNGSIPLSINPDGNNVGIGMTNPSYKLHVNGTLGVTGKLYTTSIGSTRNLLMVPGGEYVALTGSVTGYLKITLPVTWNSTMMRFDVFIYNYVTGESCLYSIGGYNFTSKQWYNATVCSNRYLLSSKGNLTVRFGHDGSKCCIYIGESTTAWSYPLVVIRNVFLGGGGGGSSVWNETWDIDFTTTLASNIDLTISNPATNYISLNADKLTTARTINGTNFDGSANITTAKWGTTRTLTIGNSSKSVDGSANISWSLSEIGAAASSHSHSYLPLSGGSMNKTALITCYTKSVDSTDVYNGGIQLREAGGSTTTIEDNMYNAPGITFHWGGRWVKKLNLHAADLYWDNSKIWHLNNGGSGSGLDADKLDGKHASSFALSSHTHSYLPLSGGTMNTDAKIQWGAKGSNFITDGDNNAANGYKGALNNLVISSWYGISFTTSRTGLTCTNLNAVSINCRNGYLYAGKLFSNGTEVSVNGHNHDSSYVSVAGDTMTGTLNMNNKLYINSSGYIYPYSTSVRTSGMYGVYDSAKIGHIWSMGTSYKIATDGTTFGNLYGFAYKHTNNTTGGTMAGGHMAVWCLNGSPKVALGDYVWAANGFKKNGSSDSYVLLGGGGHKALSDFTAKDPTDYYWANIPIGTSANKLTSPTFSNMHITSIGYIHYNSDTSYQLRLFCDNTLATILSDKVPLSINPHGNNVGIGTDSPSLKLTVSGNVLANGFIKSGSSDSYILLGGGGHKALSDFGSATVNSGTASKLAYYSETNTIDDYTSSIGSSIKPIYLDAGVPTASTSTVGSSTIPVYLSSGSITAGKAITDYYWANINISEIPNFSTSPEFEDVTVTGLLIVGNSVNSPDGIIVDGNVLIGNGHRENWVNYRNSLAIGLECYLNAFNSLAVGYKCTVSGFCSVSLGYKCESSAIESFSSGVGINASYKYNFVIGRYNTISDNYFIIGNGGTDASRGNAFRVSSSGYTYANGPYSSSGADYAEVFEWLDGNPNLEDRVGYFVTLKGNKILIASPLDSYILGIVSANPVIIGSNPIDWNKKYLTDEWGRPLYDLVEVNHGNGKITLEKQYRFNPNYDCTKEYKARNDRPEWGTIGLMGQLLVRQDGSLTEGSFCKCGNNGIATKSDSGYYVMLIINNKIAKIMFK